MFGSDRMRLPIAAFAASSPLTRASRPTDRSYRASADALSANRESPEYATIRAHAPFDGPNESSRAPRRLSVTRSAGMGPVAPRARSTPSIVAQSIPLRCAAVFRFAANFGERRSAGGVGSGSGEFSQIVAALAGPSISGFAAGFVFGSSTLRSCVHCDCASLRRPPARRAWAREPDELLVALDEPCDDDEDDGLLLTWVKPPSDVPAVDSAASAESVPADVPGAGAAAAASLEGSDVAADSSAAGAGDWSAAAAAADEESSAVVVVVASIATESSSEIEAEKRLPATAASEAPAKNRVVNTKVVASRRLRPLVSPDSGWSGSGLPPKSQFSLRVNHRGIAVCSFWIEPLAATRGAECGLLIPSAAACGAPTIDF